MQQAMNRIEKRWEMSSTINKIGMVYWVKILVAGTDIIVCKVCGTNEKEAFIIAYDITERHNNDLIQ